MRFAFLIHPLKTQELTRKYKLATVLPEWALEQIMKRKSPIKVCDITGIKSKTGATTEGVFLGLPLTPKLMMSMPVDDVYGRIVEAAELAKSEDCQIMGLGAFTSVVGDGGITVAERSPIAITTGNSYTGATAIEGVFKACEMLEINPAESILAIVGATGSIGQTCSEIMAPQFKETILVGRDMAKVESLSERIPKTTASTNISDISRADCVITVSSAGAEIIQPEHLKVGSIVCDVARPRDVSGRVAKERPDILVIEGGVVRVPGDVDFGMNFGFPEKTAFACMSETIMLALENRAENYSLGKDLAVEKVRETQEWAIKHGFELAGFRSFEKAVDEEAIDRVREARVRANVAAAT